MYSQRVNLCRSSHQFRVIFSQKNHFNLPNFFADLPTNFVSSFPKKITLRSFDVFINHRGPDVKQTLASQLYSSLAQLGIRAFLDSEEKELGVSFPSIIETAIRTARVHIAIFSRGYAESIWCLAELLLMLSSGAIILPLYYEVEPWELRHIEKGRYAYAFSEHEKRGRYSDLKLNEWKEALRSVSVITGYKINKLSDFNCEPIVSAVQEQLRRSQVARYPVGLSELVEELESRCLPEDFERQYGTNEEGQGKALIVSIYGMGGAGKTTLSKELFNRHRSKYNGASFLADVRETSARGELPSLQLKLLKDLFDNHHLNFHRTEEGNSYLRYAFQSRRDWRFLIVLDDIDRVEQLDDLLDLDSMNSGCLVIVTTRNEQVLRDANIARRYKMKELTVKQSRELFCWHAFRQADPPSDYKDLVESFVEESGFLPLSLQIFGGLVRDKIDIDKWQFYLDKVRKQLSPGIKDILQISVDTLDEEERQMFMDTACFFIDKPKSMAIQIWEGCGWKAQQALENLEGKCLVRIAGNYLAGYEFDDNLVLKMHDHIRDLGREMADDPSFPRRNWRPQSLESNGLQNILRETSGSNSRCLNSFFDSSITSQIAYFLGNLDQTRTSLLWLELELDGCEQPSLPSWIPLQHLRSLRIFSAHLNELRQTTSQAPVHLKELVLHECSLAECTNSIAMLNDLEKLVLTGRNEGMLVDGRALSESLRGLSKLRNLVLRYFTLTGEFTLNRESSAFSALTYFAWICAAPCLEYFSSNGKAELIKDGEPTASDSAEDRCMTNLQTMEMRGIKRVSKVSISGEYCGNLESLRLASMPNLIQVDLTLMRTLNCLELMLCEQLKRVSGNFDLPKLVTLKIVKCGELEELPSLKHLSSLESIAIDGCEKLQKLTGVEELQKIRCLHLSGGSDMLRCILRLQKLPSEVTSVIGKASHQAKTILDANQFCDVIGGNTNIAIDLSETGTMPEESLNMLNSLSAIIICAVVRGSYASGTNAINIRLPSGLIQSNIGGGIWIVTIVITGEKDVADYKELLTVGDDAQIKKWWMVTINKKGGNGLEVFKKIITRLY